MDSYLQYYSHPYGMEKESTHDFPNYRSEIDCGDVATETISEEQLKKLLSPPSAQPVNPKGIAGQQKVGMHVIPPSVLMQCALALKEGAIKYDPYNWRETPILASDYYDSTWRHIADWWEGQDIDPKSGIPHVIKAIAGLIVLADAIQQNKFIDDRALANINPNWMDDMNAAHVDLVERVTKAKGAP